MALHLRQTLVPSMSIPIGFFLLVLAHGNSMAGDLAPESRFLAAAYSWWTSDDLPPKDLPYEYLTHVSHCFVLGDKDGNLVLRDRVPDLDLIKTAHENGVRVILALGGQDSNAYFSPMASRPCPPWP